MATDNSSVGCVDGGDDVPDQNLGSQESGQSVQWHTVAFSVGLAALASALVIGVGSFFALSNSGSGTPVVMLDGSAETVKTTSPTSKARPTSKATTKAKAPGQTSKAPAPGGGSNSPGGNSGGTPGGGSGNVPRGNSGGGAPILSGEGDQEGSADPVDDGIVEDDGNYDDGGDTGDDGGEDMPAAPSSDELLGTLNAMLDPGADQEFIESNLQSPSGAQTFRDTTAQMENYPGFGLEFVEEPYVDEDGVLVGNAKFVYAGNGEKPAQSFYWVVRDGRWVLSDVSVCDLANQARVSCSI